MESLPGSVDVLVIGAGPAGSVAAAQLARRGFRVLVVERQWFPRHVIGESLLPRCNELLAKAGLLQAVEARGYMVKHGALFLRGDERQRFQFRESLGGDWTSSFQVPRDDLDQTLATAARGLGADVRFGCEVRGLRFEGEGAEATVVAEGQGEARVRARFVLDCSGPARVLSRALSLDEPADILARVAIYTHVEGDVRPQGDEEGDIWVVLHQARAWLWIIPFSNGRTSVGAVIEPSALDAVAGDGDGERLWALVRTDRQAAARLGGARQVQPIRRLHNWTSVTRKLHGPGWAVAGNAGDFLDPVFSSGVMFALESGTLAAEAAARQLSGEEVDWERDYQERLRGAVQVFRTFVKAWYEGELAEIFFSQKKAHRAIQSITSILGGNVFNQENWLVRRDTRAGLEMLLSAVGKGP
jgi:flavin-dependent dehydrogenase